MADTPPPYPRPLSPHLQIYRPQLTSVLSIFHRATGIGLAVAAYGFVAWLACLSFAPTCFLWWDSVLRTWLGQTVIWSTVFCAYYHIANGVRHLIWDAGFGFQLKHVYMSGMMVVSFTLVATGVTWVLSH
jgi:succinate dehydrogenase / fumarate reductase cytochrome b subunit